MYTGVGQWQDSKTASCNVTLSTSPASPGPFVAGTDICLAGPFQEEATVSAVGGVSTDNIQQITFSTRYAWDGANGNINAALVMQGGVCGQSMVATSTITSWPIAYALVGATSGTQLYFSNCRGGYCNGRAGGTILDTPTDVTFYPSAFITGTLNGLLDGANLGVNTVPFQPGDDVVGAPTSEFTQDGINLYLGQSSPTYGSTGITVDDAGPYPLTQDIFVNNHAGITPTMMTIDGAFDETFHMDHRPSNGGAIIYNNGVYTTPSAAPYLIYADGNDLGYGVLPSTTGGSFGFDPSSGNFTLNSNPVDPAVPVMDTLLINGVPVCVQGGPCASGPSGVPSVNGITSAVTIAAGDGVSVSNSGSTVTVANTEPLNATALESVLSAPPFNIASYNCGSGVVYAAPSPSPYGLIKCDPGTQNVRPGYWLLSDGSLPGMQLNGAGSYIGLFSNQPGAFDLGLQIFGDDTTFDGGSGTEYIRNVAGDITAQFLGAYGDGFFAGGLTVDSGIADTALSTVGGVITIGSYGRLTDSGVLAANLIQTSTTAHGDLSGTYASPTVTAVHAVSGTIDGVTIGGITPQSGTFGALASSSYIGPSTAPSGSCPTSGAWVFSQDGHATFCASGTWVTKI
jgi:hypothetical protein